jgi:hypothetical protein
MAQPISSQFCYIHVRGHKPGDRIGIVQYLDTGYFPTQLDNPNQKEADEVDETIDSLNGRLDISVDVRYAMEAGSMFGWRVPAARAALEHFGSPELT